MSSEERWNPGLWFEAMGAEILLGPMEIPGHGTIAIYMNGGIQQGLWQLP